MIQKLLMRLLPGLAAIAATFRYGVGCYAWAAANKLERPQYTVVEKLGAGGKGSTAY